jgi:hypothetical protein
MTEITVIFSFVSSTIASILDSQSSIQLVLKRAFGFFASILEQCYTPERRPNCMPCFPLKLGFPVKDHFAIYKISISCFLDIKQNSVSSRLNDRASIPLLWNVFCPEVVPDVLAKYSGFPFQRMFFLSYFIHVWFQVFNP